MAIYVWSGEMARAVTAPASLTAEGGKSQHRYATGRGAPTDPLGPADTPQRLIESHHNGKPARGPKHDHPIDRHHRRLAEAADPARPPALVLRREQRRRAAQRVERESRAERALLGEAAWCEGAGAFRLGKEIGRRGPGERREVRVDRLGPQALRGRREEGRANGCAVARIRVRRVDARGRGVAGV